MAKKKDADAKKKDADTCVEEVNELIDSLGGPENMSKEEYRDFLEGVIADCQMKLETVVQELEEE